jgi:hypothetical protein
VATGCRSGGGRREGPGGFRRRPTRPRRCQDLAATQQGGRDTIGAVAHRGGDCGGGASVKDGRREVVSELLLTDELLWDMCAKEKGR